MNDFISSDYCTECGGIGYVRRTDHTEKFHQCEECERLHNLEVEADRLQDEWKGN